jgi:hypothetical protein
VNISVVDTYSRMELCTQMLLGEASKKIGWKIILKKIKTHNVHIP